MASETTNLHLVKPDPTEAVDVEPLNENCDKIDDAYAALAAEITNKVDKVTGKGLSTNDYTNAAKTALVELVDGGAKNIANPLNACGYLTQGSTYPITIGGVTFTLGADGSITTSGTSTSVRTLRIPVTLPAGTYHFGGTPSGGGSSSGRIDIREPGTDTFITTTTDTGEGFFYTFGATTSLDFCIRIAANYAESMTFKPMICTTTDYAISPKFVPYAKSNAELSKLTQYTNAMAEAAVFGAKISISANTDLNNINNAGKFVCGSATLAASLSHCPTGKPFVLLVDFIAGSTRMIQRIYAYDSTTGVQENYQRCYIASGWGAWYVTSAGSLGVALTSNTNMNDVVVPGEYRIETSAIASTITNLPPNTGWTGHVVVQGLNTPTAERLMQIYTPVWANADRDGKVYIRHLKGTNSWSNWFVFSGTALT